MTVSRARQMHLGDDHEPDWDAVEHTVRARERDYLFGPPSGHASNAVPTGGSSDPSLVERARRYLAKMPGAVSGQGGHATTFRAAVAIVRGFELAPEDALRLLAEVHNPLCSPAWSVAELRHKVKSAAMRGQMPMGALANKPRERGAA